MKRALSEERKVDNNLTANDDNYDDDEIALMSEKQSKQLHLLNNEVVVDNTLLMHRLLNVEDDNEAMQVVKSHSETEKNADLEDCKKMPSTSVCKAKKPKLNIVNFRMEKEYLFNKLATLDVKTGRWHCKFNSEIIADSKDLKVEDMLYAFFPTIIPKSVIVLDSELETEFEDGRFMLKNDSANSYLSLKSCYVSTVGAKIQKIKWNKIDNFSYTYLEPDYPIYAKNKKTRCHLIKLQNKKMPCIEFNKDETNIKYIEVDKFDNNQALLYSLFSVDFGKMYKKPDDPTYQERLCITATLVLSICQSTNN